MSVADRSIDPRIMESAKEEFLQKGFLDASLQEICKNAGVTTGALYKRFKGKEELFCALVESTVQDLEEVVRQKSVLPATLTDEQLKKAWDMDREYMQWWFEYLYDRYDEMRLLLVFSGRNEVRELRARMGGEHEPHHLCVLQGSAEAWSDKDGHLRKGDARHAVRLLDGDL